MQQWLDWHNLYDDGWRGLIVDEAFAHPAKAARGLIRRIFAHMEQQGWLPPRSRVLDVFGGIGTTGIEGASRGHEVVCVELEERFYKLALENFALHRRVWEASGDPLPVILHGDSRQAAALVRGHFAACVGSPPFVGSGAEGDGRKKIMTNAFNADPANSKKPGWRPNLGGENYERPSHADSYGQSPGQLGAMREGNVDAVVGSPPYAESIKGDHAERETASESTAKRRTEGGSLGKSQRHGGYGGKDNLGNLSEGECDAVVASPPYEPDALGHTGKPTAIDVRKKLHGRINNAQYGNSPGQLGNSTGETFWQASRVIMEQVHQLVKPGGICAWICKDYVKQGKRVPFCDNWARLCESCGFRVVQRARCWLVKEETHAGLFGDVTKKTERKSFFRRLHERKPGAVRIDWEEVIFASAISR